MVVVVVSTCRFSLLIFSVFTHFLSDDLELVNAAKQVVQLDDELAVTETEINTKCPVTQMEMKHPVKNRHCGHHYDLGGAKQLIRNRPHVRFVLIQIGNPIELGPTIWTEPNLNLLTGTP